MEKPFGPLTIFWLVVLGSVSLIAGFFAMAIDSKSEAPDAGPSAYSRSALGHAAFVEILEEASVPVVVSQSTFALGLRERGLLVLAEPRPWEVEGGRELYETMLSRGRVLLVLPKRVAYADPERSQFVSGAGQMPESQIEDLLAAIDRAAELVRSEDGAGPAWQSEGLRYEPDFESVQLVRSGQLEPILWSDRGTLLGRVRSSDSDLWILSDPDLIATHGLAGGDNALLALDMVDRLREDREPVVFDETLHGYRRVPSLWRELSEFPLILATLHVMLCAVVFVWGGARRFGAARAPEPAHEAGPADLIENSASLIQLSGGSGPLIRRYLDETLRSVARSFWRSESFEGREALVQRLAELGERRGVSIDLRALAERVSELSGRHRAQRSEVTEAARRVHRWKQEILHGAGSGPQPR